MPIRHPLDAIPPGRLRLGQVPALCIAGLCLAALPLVLPSRTDHTLLDLVEAGTVARATEILATWSADDRVRAAYAVGLDYLMNPAYMSVLAIAAVWAGRAIGTKHAGTAASVLAWLAWSVVLTNVVENVGLYRALSSGPAAPWPGLVAYAHGWAGIVIVVLVGFVGLGVLVRVRREPERDPLHES